ncbi:iron complex transport system substrate-binding protein [Rhodovulum sp. ES.010]|uniref:ABC transporter substrate-binding protein n=1 Tax=Rhodovulum sp. ES.010 TaxID=1882821 RepID=UPI00092B16EF|nr:ABC transporter substrate-binding protein [Rhodovulum sp. ES.010]SIO40687.1 iron complex transport system substrate-binding protein [Rhodovulum sp. ES.010]
MRPSRLIALAAALACAGAAALAKPPERVVSMNLCTDQLAMLIAGEGQLVSVSDLAADPRSSPMAQEAGAYPANGGGAEEIALMRPDLVLAGVYSDPATLGMLRRLGIPVAQIEITRSVAEIPAQLRRVGELLGRTARAEALATAFKAGLAALSRGDGPRPLAAIFHPNGYTQGAGTLSDDILAHAGFDNLAAELGLRQGGRLALEEVVTADPDLLILSRPYPASSRAEEILAHPALRDIAAAERPAFTGPDWTCGTPHVLDAIARLAERRATLPREE